MCQNLQILFQLELWWFWIEENGRFGDFFDLLCSKKLSVQWHDFFATSKRFSADCIVKNACVQD